MTLEHRHPEGDDDGNDDGRRDRERVMELVAAMLVITIEQGGTTNYLTATVAAVLLPTVRRLSLSRLAGYLRRVSRSAESFPAAATTTAPLLPASPQRRPSPPMSLRPRPTPC